jgi:CheY-like chemotaxis protein
VRLPAYRVDEGAEPGSIPQVSLSDSEVSLAGARVLLVEDTPDTRDAFVHVLEGAGVRVTAVDSAAAGFAAYRQDRPDVLVTDIAMPGEDGYSLIRRIRALDQATAVPAVPAVAVTALARDSAHARTLEAEFDAYAGKPVTAERLLSLVRQALKGRALSGS